MIDTNDIGKLMYLPLTDIQPIDAQQYPNFIIAAAAEMLLKTNGLNWLPVIVKQTDKYQYKIVSNVFTYAVAQEAGLDRVWCVITDSEPATTELIKVLSREKIPKVNLSTASRDVIRDVLSYLIQLPNSPLSKVDLLVATSRISEADRSEWHDLSPISKLKCGITKGPKLNLLNDIFYLLPSPPIELPPLPQSVSVKNGSKEDILNNLRYLSDNKINAFNKIDVEKIADLIFNSDKSKWKSLNPISNLDCGVPKSKINTLKTVLKL